MWVAKMHHLKGELFGALSRCELHATAHHDFRLVL